MLHLLRYGFLALVGTAFILSGCGDCVGTSSLTDTNQDQWNIGDPDDAGQDSADETGSHSHDAGDDTDVVEGPSCEPEFRCAEHCCQGDQLCLGGNCILPGDECSHSSQCAADEFCEPILNKCLPELAAQCTYEPDFDSFDPVIEVAWQDGPETPMPSHNQVMMTPAVIDITGDGIPEIIFSTFTGSNYNADSILRAINGRTYEPVFDIVDADLRVAGSASLAVGDIDSDGHNEIVAVRSGGTGLIAFKEYPTGWDVMWQTENFSLNWDGAYLADLDGDGTVEVVAADRVYDGATGAHLCTGSGVTATPKNSIAVDLTGNGKLEVLGGNGAFEFINNGDGTYDCPLLWNYEGSGNGFPAVADFGTFNGEDHQYGAFDGLPEVAVVTGRAADTVRLHNGQTGELIWAANISPAGHPHFSVEDCSVGNAGPPTIADFNGDGLPNVATAGACFYAVFDERGEIMWRHPSQDFSSKQTGSSVFDFQGDGRAEAVYADECFLRVYDGVGNGDGTTNELFKIANTSGTTRELPVIVDVDADFHAEIVLIGNDYSGVTNSCTNNWPDFLDLGGSSRGIRVIRDRENRWVTTRPVWNQHAYSVTHVCDGLDDTLCPAIANRPGAIPPSRFENWDVDHLNNFRQNSQGEGLFLAPDLVISHVESRCDTEGFTIDITVANEGSQSVIEGLDVALFAMVEGEETLVTVLQTTQLLAPGSRETLTYVWEDSPFEVGSGEEVQLFARANDDGSGQRQYRECNESNNERPSTAICSCLSDDDCTIAEYCADNGQCRPVPL